MRRLPGELKGDSFNDCQPGVIVYVSKSANFDLDNSKPTEIKELKCPQSAQISCSLSPR